MIRSAYSVQEFQIVGGPPWLNVDRWDIQATATGDIGPERSPDGPTRQQLMVRALLQDRFGLATHTETRDMPVFALILARRDGRLGTTIQPVTTDCTRPASARGTAPPAGQPQLPPCSTSVGPGFVRTRGQTLARFATALSTLSNTGSSLNRIIIDRTGLAGAYNIELHFTPDRIPQFSSGPPPPGFPALDPNGPSIFTAVQEQLGLKLDAQRGPVEVLVIDKAERPTAD